mgnify:CR=1 FL=1
MMIINPIRILIAIDTLSIREYLNMVLSHEPDMKIVNSVGNAALALEQALTLKPNVVLIDIEMGTIRAGIDTIRTLAAKAPDIRVLVFSHLTYEETVLAAFEAGAVDYLPNNSSVIETLAAIRAAVQEHPPIRPEIARLIRKEFRTLRSQRANLVATLNTVYKLTPTELELLKLFAEGKTPSQIITMRQIEASTFRTHVGNMLKKFKANSVGDVVYQLKHLGVFEAFIAKKH